MKLQLETGNISAYLAASEVLDFEEPIIQGIAQKLSATAKTDVELAKLAYEFVRDQISHSFDIHGRTVTCKASEVLKCGEGICFAKAHLLAAFLRSLDIPTGLCYQRLVFNDEDPTLLTLHGLNAIYLGSLERWIRVDARGNKPGVNAAFSLTAEALAYPVRPHLGEVDDPTIYAQPHASVVAALQQSSTLDALRQNLPQDLSRSILLSAKTHQH